MKRRSTMVRVDVEVDLEECLNGMDDDEIMSVMETLGYRCTPINTDCGDPWTKLADAIRMQADPMPNIRQTVSDVTGRIL